MNPAAPERLKTRAQFLKVAASGRKWVAAGLIVQARPREAGETGCRIGFTVSRKVGNAVKRNRARRRLRAVAAEAMRERSHPDYDFVIIGRPAAIDRPYIDLLRDFQAALARFAP